jgi:hypothetical protein
MQKIDALLNGVAFIALLLGLAIGYRRSPALRQTLLELFLPGRLKARRAAQEDHALEAKVEAIRLGAMVHTTRYGNGDVKASHVEAFIRIRENEPTLAASSQHTRKS